MDEAGAFHYSSASHDTKDLGELKPMVEGLLQAERAALERIVWRKFDTWIIPFCTCFFLLAFLDKHRECACSWLADIAGHFELLGVSHALVIRSPAYRFSQYTIALTVTYIPYIVAEIPAALLLKYVGPDLMLPTMVSLWGVASATQGLVNNYSGLLACQFFLGLNGRFGHFQASFSLLMNGPGGLFPGIVLYLSSFYPRNRLQIRIAAFYVSSSLSGAFSGFLAAAIDQINGQGGKPGWAWTFILLCIWCDLLFHSSSLSPETARFLTEKERAYVISTLKHAGSVSEEEAKDNFSWMEIVRAAKSPHVWLLAILTFLNGNINVLLILP
ncbi:MFS general substrate transporter [Imleria badia]|nr:MFS general substrate transporter [Imleria badia]